jgi:uncharacterized protein
MRIILSLIKISLGIIIGIFIAAILYPSYIPLGTLDKDLSEFSTNSIIDMHLHVAGLGYGDSGCFVGPDLMSSYKKYAYLMAFGVSESELEEHGDEFLVKRVSSLVSESKFVKKAVVLAMDGFVDEHGVLQSEKTQIYVPNEYISKVTKKYPGLLYGASVHPYRKDAIKRLRQAKREGAVLVKWIPAIMNIDPQDKRLVPFYEELISLDLPLLTHAGQEKAFAHAQDEYGDPKRLLLPLELGVKVIAAHIATTGVIEGEEMIDRLLPLFKRYPNLFADISSLTQINKLQYVDKGLLNENLFKRVFYGSDCPLQFFPLVSPWYYVHRISPADIQFINAHTNALDRDVLLKYALGVPEYVFENGNTIFKNEPPVIESVEYVE